MHDVCIRPGDFLLPAQPVNLTAWACVACDQYTSQPEYWREAEALVGDRPSALRLILPEIFLNESFARVPSIHAAMRAYLQSGILVPRVNNGFVLVERETESGTRLGLVAALDLESYDFRRGTGKPVRATEGTILERIPARLQIRRGAPLELSHVLLLVDDPARSVLEPLHAKRASLVKLYGFPLMLGGGRLKGYAVTEPDDQMRLNAALDALASRGGMLFAVGDGNHSLASAKAYWDELKPTLSSEAQADHPARFAMVEIENIHDEALVFSPIHRVLCGIGGVALLAELEAYAAKKGWTLHEPGGGHCATVVSGGVETELFIGGSSEPLMVGALQTFLDEWMPAHPGLRLDYVHGEETARALADAPDTVAFLLPAMHKSELFPAVEKLGVLPRKTFSMGEAHEKRYYMEARKIQP